MPEPAGLSALEPPFYAVDVVQLERVFDAFKAAFAAEFPRFEVGYSYKTNYLPALCKILHGRGAWAEVVSRLEYALALELGVPAERIIFNGPGKSEADVLQALRAGSTLNLDSLDEVGYACAAASKLEGPPRRIGLRVNLQPPEGARPSRFGIDRENGDLARAAELLAATRQLELSGLHAHHSRPPRAAEQYEDVARQLATAAVALGLSKLSYLDVGGGFGYAPPDFELSFPSFEDYARAVGRGLQTLPAGAEYTLFAEPGIAVVGSAISYYAPVTAIKNVGGRQLAVVDASVHTVKPTRHRYNLPTRALDRGHAPLDGPESTYDVVGYTCMEDDFIGVDVQLPRLKVGDLLRFDNVGAYTIVFKPPFIRAAPAIYLQHADGRCEVARRAESLTSMLADYEL